MLVSPAVEYVSPRDWSFESEGFERLEKVLKAEGSVAPCVEVREA